MSTIKALYYVSMLVMTSTSLMLSANAGADIDRIQCQSNVCLSLNSEQLDQIERVIDAEVSKYEINESSTIAIIPTRKLNLELSEYDKKWLSREKNIRGSKLRVVVISESVDILNDQSLNSNQSHEMASAITSMASFHYSPFEENSDYVSTNVILEKNNLLNKNSDYRVRMRTIGFGTQIKKHFSVEIGLIMENSKALLKINKPNGLLLNIRKKW